MSLTERVKATMKSEDTEGAFELYVTRTPGYLWALFFKALHIHPIVVTLISIVIGTSCGYFFYFDDLKMNLIGMLMLIWANWYDCADGQLARMTNQRTAIGRFLDGLGGELWFLSIYVSLALRMDDIYGWWIWPLLLFTGFYCHARQAALADYYRNIHLWFLFAGKGNGNELDRSSQTQERYKLLLWKQGEWMEKAYLLFYMLYTRGQEIATPWFQRFYEQLQTTYGKNIPDNLRLRFRIKSRPLMKYCNILTFDSRVGVFFLSILTGWLLMFPMFEIFILEPLRYYVKHRHEGFCHEFYNELTNHEA